MAKDRGTGIPAVPPVVQPTPAPVAQITQDGKPVSPAVARSRGGAAAAQGHGNSGNSGK